MIGNYSFTCEVKKQPLHKQNYIQELREASQNGNANLVKNLLSEVKNNRAVITYCALLACLRGHLDIVKILASAGADMNSYNNGAIKRAVQNKNYEMIKYLIKIGVNVGKVKLDCIFVEKMFVGGYFSELYEFLKNDCNYPIVQKIVTRINNNLLINCVKNINVYIDVLFVFK